MSEDRKTLLASLKDTVLFFKERKTVGRMKTEHSIFIPASLMINQEAETAEFITAARMINEKPEWNCPVAAEQVTTSKVPGVEFVFTFGIGTNFDAIIKFIDSGLY